MVVLVRLIASGRAEFDLLSYGHLHWCVPFSTCMRFLRDQSCNSGFISLLNLSSISTTPNNPHALWMQSALDSTVSSNFSSSGL
eukprot:s1038_g12.t1